jgi:hypothetical protein
MISGVIATLLLYRGAQIASGYSPYQHEQIYLDNRRRPTRPSRMGGSIPARSGTSTATASSGSPTGARTSSRPAEEI